MVRNSWLLCTGSQLKLPAVFSCDSMKTCICVRAWMKTAAVQVHRDAQQRGANSTVAAAVSERVTKLVWRPNLPPRWRRQRCLLVCRSALFSFHFVGFSFFLYLPCSPRICTSPPLLSVSASLDSCICSRMKWLTLAYVFVFTLTRDSLNLLLNCILSYEWVIHSAPWLLVSADFFSFFGGLCSNSSFLL